MLHLIKKILLENKRYEDEEIQRIVSQLNIDLKPHDYLASGGTADIYEYKDKIIKFHRESETFLDEVKDLYKKIEGKKFNNVINIHHFLYHFLDRHQVGINYYLVVIIMEKLTPLDKVFTEYNIPSIIRDKGVQRHPFVHIVAILGDIILDEKEEGSKIDFSNVTAQELFEIKRSKAAIGRMGKDNFFKKWEEYKKDPQFIKMLEDAQAGVYEIEPYFDYYDLSFDNIMYDKSTKQFKIIDLD